MFSDVLSAEAVELVVASLFLAPGTCPPPASATAGFLRFLWRLGHHDWLNEPLIVNTSGNITDDDALACFVCLVYHFSYLSCLFYRYQLFDYYF